MASTAAKVSPRGIIHECNRSTYRTSTESGYERYSSILCGCERVIDLEVQVSADFQSDVWILVFDTTINDPANLVPRSVPYLPAKKVSPGFSGKAKPSTEWIPFNYGILIVASASQVLDLSLLGDDIISTYCRYSVKGGC
jgi:hypothetical protein